MPTSSERLIGLGYTLGWKLICRVPESWARGAFMFAADIAWRRQGPRVQVLEANLRRVIGPQATGKQLRALSREGMRSYARYWLEVFRLPVISRSGSSGTCAAPARSRRRSRTWPAGRGVIFALPHMGNWEHAGAWIVARGADRFTTVAERLKPDSVVRQVRRVPGEPGHGGAAGHRRREQVRRARRSG